MKNGMPRCLSPAKTRDLVTLTLTDPVDNHNLTNPTLYTPGPSF